MASASRRLGAAAAALAGAAALGCIYFYYLSGVGLLGPDEPRYASIGFAMARSGDWLTPRLWGAPWFEKPPLLYWLIAAARAAGLSGETAVRLPVALLGAAFTLFFGWTLARRAGLRAGLCGALMLATSAGWAAYSNVGVTDIPLAATFGAAMLLALDGRPALAGVALGFAVLAKGLVPLVLAAPLVYWFWRRWRALAWTAACAIAVAAPWYAAMLARHGRVFLDEFIVKHHFSRFAAPDLQHVQPWWFYLPVLLAGLYPWTPLLAALGTRGLWRTRESRFLALWVGWGLLFFSAAANKLPGYLLPLLPAVFALLGMAAIEARRLRSLLALAALLLSFVPVIVTLLPQALASGLSRASLAGFELDYLVLVLPLIGVVWLLDRPERRAAAVGVLAAAATAALLLVKLAAFPLLDATVSARPLWRQVAPRAAATCVDTLHRSLRYGLNFYSVTPLPDCAGGPRRYAITQEPGDPPRVADRSSR